MENSQFQAEFKYKRGRSRVTGDVPENERAGNVSKRTDLYAPLLTLTRQYTPAIQPDQSEVLRGKDGRRMPINPNHSPPIPLLMF